MRWEDLDDGRRTDGQATEEREEFAQLRHENRVLWEEREIPKKAVGWFAREPESSPRKASHS